MRLNSSASAPSSSLLAISIRWSSAPEPIFAAAAWIVSIGRTSLRASSTPVAVARSRNATSSSAVRQIADFERCERLAQRLLDEDVPAERIDRLEGAQHLRPVQVAPGRRRVGGVVRGRAERACTCGSEAKFVRRRTRLTSGCVMSSPRQSTAYAYPAVPTRALDRPAGHEGEVDLGHDDAASGRTLGHGDRHVGLGRRAEVDVPEVPFRRARADELRAPREVDPAVECGRARAGMRGLAPSRWRRGSSARLTSSSRAEEAVEVLFRSASPALPASVGRLGDRLELAQDVLHLLLDRSGGGGRLVLLDAASALACCPGRRSRAP